MSNKIADLEKRLKDLEDYVYNFDDFLPARSLIEKAKNYIEKLEVVSAEDLTKRFHIPEVRAKKLIELFIQYGFLIKDESAVLKTNKETFRTYDVPSYPFESGEDDPCYPKAIEFIQDFDNASASLLQRKFKIGYARAAKLLDTLEIKGYVGPAIGSKPREVLKK